MASFHKPGWTSTDLRLMRATAADRSCCDNDRAAAKATVRQATAGKAGVYLVMRVMWQAALGLLHAAGCSQDISRNRHVIIFEKDRRGDRREPISSERFRNWLLGNFGLNSQGSHYAQRRVSDKYASRIAQVLIEARPRASCNHDHDRTVEDSGEGDTGEEAVRHADTAGVSQNDDTRAQPRRSKRKQPDGNDGQDSGAKQDSAARASSSSMPLRAVPNLKNLHQVPAGLTNSEPRYPRLKIDMVTSQPSTPNPQPQTINPKP
jgi:hypothetical protein